VEQIGTAISSVGQLLALQDEEFLINIFCGIFLLVLKT
jgi:hypothetical protein